MNPKIRRQAVDPCHSRHGCMIDHEFNEGGFFSNEDIGQISSENPLRALANVHLDEYPHACSLSRMQSPSSLDSHR